MRVVIDRDGGALNGKAHSPRDGRKRGVTPRTAGAGGERHVTRHASTASRSPRDPVMTTFYAIAGLLVVASHAHGAIDIAYNVLPLYSYQIGMFLFASGWFYHERNELHPLRWAWKRVRHLLLPLFAINAAYGVIGNLVAPLVGFEFVPQLGMDALVRQPLLGGDMFVLDNPLWFVFPFFCATAIDFALHTALDALTGTRAHGRGDALGSASVGGSGASAAIDVGLAIAYTVAFVTVQPMPGFVDAPVTSLHALAVRTLFMMPLVAYGRVLSHHCPRVSHATTRTSVLMVIASLLAAVVTVTLVGDPVFLAAHASFPAGPVAPLVTSMCGTMMWLGVSQLVGERVGRMRSVELLSRSTLGLMANQIAGFEVLNLAFLGLDRLGIVHGFDMRKFVTDIWYEYRPMMPFTVHGAQIGDAFSFVYVVFGTALVLLAGRGIALAWERIRRAARDGKARRDA